MSKTKYTYEELSEKRETFERVIKNIATAQYPTRKQFEILQESLRLTLILKH